jgi:hypothetical protein
LACTVCPPILARKEYVTPRELYTWHVGGVEHRAVSLVRDALSSSGFPAEMYDGRDHHQCMAALSADAERADRAYEAYLATLGSDSDEGSYSGSDSGVGSS